MIEGQVLNGISIITDWKIGSLYCKVLEEISVSACEKTIAGYKVLQQKSIVHQDIKPDNILIGRNGQYKISDFGLSEIIEIKRDRKLAKGSLPFMAP